MKVCLDVDYRTDHAYAAAVAFADWADAAPAEEAVERVDSVEPYVPGAFYRRELPCLLAVLARLSAPAEWVVIDGYVWLGDESHPGLGGRLYEALGRSVPVIGVAKSCFRSATLAVPVVRGEGATRPLFVTAAGVDARRAAEWVRAMHGPHRLPTLIKRADSLCRRAGAAPPAGGAAPGGPGRRGGPA